MTKKGFTFLELTIVIAVVALLAAAIFATIKPGQRKYDTYDALRLSAIGAIHKAIELYNLDNYSQPPSLSSLTTGVPYMIVKKGGSTVGTATCTSTAAIAKVDLLTDVQSYLPENVRDPILAISNNETGYFITKVGNDFTIGNCYDYSDTVVVGINLSGHLYSDDGSTVINCAADNKTVKVLVNGVLASTATCTENTGAWQGDTSMAVASGDIISAFLDGESQQATTVLKSNGSSISNLDLYQDRVIVRSDTGSLTNTNLNTADNGDSDILYNVSSNNLTVDSGKELHVWASSTFAPGAGNVTAPALMHVDTGATVSIDSGQTVTLSLTSGSALTLTGTVSGAGTLVYMTTTSFPTTGTISSILKMDATNGNQTLGARTYGGAVQLINTGTTNRTITGAAGTAVYSSTLSLSKTGSGTLTLDLNTNDPTSTISSTLTIGSGTTFSANSANTLNINGNYSNSGTFTDNLGTVTLAGSAQQTFSGTMTGTSDFRNLTITNASGSDPDASPSVIFSSALTTTATFSATTANTKIRFAAGSSYTLQNINFNGQAAGTRVYLRSSSGGTAWILACDGTQAISYTNVKDSDASESALEIDASNGTNIDATGNTFWTF